MIKLNQIMMRAHLEVMEGYLRLAGEFGLGIEFGDFCLPEVLENPKEYTRRLTFAKERILPLGLKRTFHTPFKEVSPHSAIPELRKHSRNLIERSLETAQELDCSLAVVHTAYDENNDNSRELDRAASDFIPFLESLLAQTELNICLENIHDRDTRFLDRLLEAIDHPRLGVCLDVGHMSAFGDMDFTTWYAHYGSRTFHNHWHDNDGSCDAHGALGSGTIDWDSILNLRDSHGPDSTVALEIPHEEGIRQSLALLKPYLEN